MAPIIIIAAIVLLYVVYAFLSELVCKYLHVGTLWRGPSTLRSVALTFDDGPDPRYTPQVLEILREHGVHATFFLVGRRAKAHPDLVQQMLADGHEIASHGDTHRHAWLLDPVSTWRDIAVAKRTLETLTGGPIRYYRPPWGTFNLVTRLASAVLHLRPTLWSVRAIDWLPGSYASDVVQRVVRGAHPGAIVLAHDAGGAEGAPNNTVAALPLIISRLKAQGYEFCTVGAMDEGLCARQRVMHELFGNYPPIRRMWIGLWGGVEFLFAKAYRILDVNRVFRVSRTFWHHGERRDSDTGTILFRDGAPAIDLHFKNETMLIISSGDNRSLIRGLRMVKEGFRDIARLLVHDDRLSDVQVVMAMTLVNRGIEMLGFHVENLPETRGHRHLQSYMRFLMGMYHPEGFARLRQGRQQLELKLVWMSREEVLRLYGDKPS